jgi:hypothetical protein
MLVLVGVDRLRAERQLALSAVVTTARPNRDTEDRPEHAARDDPRGRVPRQPTPTPSVAPAMAATSSRRPVISPTARPPIAAGKMTSRPNRAGSGMLPPIVTPTSVARFQGIHVLTIAPMQ